MKYRIEFVYPESKEVFVFDTNYDYEALLLLRKSTSWTLLDLQLGDEMEDEEFAASEDDMAYVNTDMTSVLRDGRMSSRLQPTYSQLYEHVGVHRDRDRAQLAWEKKDKDEEEDYQTHSKEKVVSDGEGGEESERESKWKEELKKEESPLHPAEEMGGRQRERDLTIQQENRGHIYLENDVYTVSKFASPRERLALSFAMAQSSILAVFSHANPAPIPVPVEELLAFLSACPTR